MEYIEKTLTGIITHGTNSITFTDDFITNDSIIDVYFSDDEITPIEQSQDGNRLIITIESQPQDVSIAIHITNDDTINYADELESLNDTVSEHTTAISDLATDVDTLENKVDGLNANNISYDEHSTLYSAMGDIDTLETESKNLVGAINEVKESGGGGGSVDFTTTDYQYKAGSNQMFMSGNAYASFTITPPTNGDKKLINAFVKSVSNVPNWCKIMSIGVDITSNKIILLLKSDQGSNAYASSSNTAWNLGLLWA